MYWIFFSYFDNVSLMVVNLRLFSMYNLNI